MDSGISEQIKRYYNPLVRLTDLKRIQNSTQMIGFWNFRADKTVLQPVGQAAEFKFESKFKPLLVIWQSLLKDSRRQSKPVVWLKNPWPSS